MVTSADPAIHASRPGRGGRCGAVALAIAAGLLGGVFAAGPSTVAAAGSPTPSAAVETNIQFFQDSAFPPGIAAGTSVTVGVTIWDTDQARLSPAGPDYIRIRPATGKAKPTEGHPTADWPGHATADVVVPAGGIGQVEVGYRGQDCTSDGTCRDSDRPFAFGGIGPPPDASRADLVEATIQEPTGPVAAGEPLDLVAQVTPRAAWDRAALGLPDLLVAIASSRNNADVSQADLHVEPTDPTLYRGQIVIPRAGEVVLTVAIPDNGAEDQVIDSSVTRLTVTGPARESPATGPSAPTPSVVVPGDGPPWVLIGVVIAAIVAAGFVISRVLADL